MKRLTAIGLWLWAAYTVGHVRGWDRGRDFQREAKS